MLHTETKNNCFIYESPCRRVSTLALDRLHLTDKPGSFEDSKISSLDRVDRWVERGVNEDSHFMLHCFSSERNVKPHIIKATSLFRNGPHESHCGVFYVPKSSGSKSCKCCNPLHVTQS